MPEWLSIIITLGVLIGIGMILPDSVSDALGTIGDYLYYIGIRFMLWLPLILSSDHKVWAIILLVIVVLVPPLGSLHNGMVDICCVIADLIFFISAFVASRSFLGGGEALMMVGAFLVVAYMWDYRFRSWG